MKSKQGKIAPLWALLALTIGALAQAATFDHKPIPYVVAGKPVRIETAVTDPKGVQQVRVYFFDFARQLPFFVPMQPQSGGRYTATLPAFARGTIGYVLLAQDRGGLATRTEAFVLPSKESGETPAWQTGSNPGVLKIFLEETTAFKSGPVPGDFYIRDATVEYVDAKASLLRGATMAAQSQARLDAEAAAKAAERAAQSAKAAEAAKAAKAAEDAKAAAAKAAADAPPSGDYCERDFYGRGVGVPMTECSAGAEYSLGSCYSQRCKAGFQGAGPICWGNCPSGFTDHGVGCTKPASYGRGVGYPWKVGDAIGDAGMYQRCEGDNGKGNCEKDGAIVYPKCKAGFHKVGCCTCSPDCPSGFGDTGATCTKPNYSRAKVTTNQFGERLLEEGLGDAALLRCPGGLERVSSLCYPPCKPNYTKGNIASLLLNETSQHICTRNCPPSMPHDCPLQNRCYKRAKDCKAVGIAGAPKPNSLGQCPAS